MKVLNSYNYFKNAEAISDVGVISHLIYLYRVYLHNITIRRFVKPYSIIPGVSYSIVPEFLFLEVEKRELVCFRKIFKYPKLHHKVADRFADLRAVSEILF